MRWLIERHVQPFGSQRLPCVVENDRVELGGMALTLLASLELYRSTRDPAALALAAGMGRYLLTQRRDNGEFAHRRIFSNGKALDEVSPFAPGQTLLALAELFSEVGDRTFLEPALETAETSRRPGLWRARPEPLDALCPQRP